VSGGRHATHRRRGGRDVDTSLAVLVVVGTTRRSGRAVCTAWWPGATLAALVVLFGAYTLVDGLLAVTLGFGGNRRGGGDRGWLLLPGVLGIAAGIVVFIWPVITAVVLLLVVAAWSVVIGVLQIIAAIQLRREIANEWFSPWAERSRCCSGSARLLNPGAGALARVWLIGLYAFVFGITLIVRGHRADPEVQPT
jgi:uncharacterized membrane protein HdeD (DUF308 family)